MSLLDTLRLDGKAAVVTGAGRGLGRAMAQALARAGARVVCAARTAVQIERTANRIVEDGGEAIAVVADVSDSAQVDACVRACVEKFGQIDVMVANAGGGVGENRPFWEYSDELFEQVLAVNLKGTFYSGRAAARAMVERGQGGAIINVASGTALRGYKDFAYPTAKGGVISLTKSEATMLGEHGIRANVIVPGFVSQEPAADEQETEDRAARGARIPVRRLGEWWELGPLAVYLASDASRYITGQSFVIDGGGLAGGLGPVSFAPRQALAGDELDDMGEW